MVWAKPSGSAREAMGFLAEGFPSLSRSAWEFVRHRPREARLAVTVALEAAAAQCETEDSGSTAEVPQKKLRPFIVRRSDSEDILGVSEAAARLEVSRTTIYDWVDRKTLLAWRGTKRGLSIPAAQILGPGRVVPGLAEVVDVIGDPELAWAFLTPGMAVRRRSGDPSRIAEGRPRRRSAGCSARIWRCLHVSGAEYPRDRIESVLLKARFHESYRIMPGHYRASPLGTSPRGFPILLQERGLHRPLRRFRFRHRVHRNGGEGQVHAESVAGNCTEGNHVTGLGAHLWAKGRGSEPD